MHLYPFLLSAVPADTAQSVSVSANLVFTMKTDAAGAASIDTSTLDISINGTPVAVAGVAQAGYAVSYAPTGTQVAITINPSANLAADTPYRIMGSVEDDLGNLGEFVYSVTTGTAFGAIQIDCAEYACPVNSITTPMFVVSTGVTVHDSAVVTSVSTDWASVNVAALDYAVIESGPNMGRWLVRSTSGSSVTFWGVLPNSVNPETLQVFKNRGFTDSSSVWLQANTLLGHRLMKVSGDTTLRYLAGNPSDANFPTTFGVVPATPVRSDSNGGSVDDQTDRILDFHAVANPTPAGSDYDRYAIPLDDPMTPAAVGTRFLVRFNLEAVDPGANVLFALTNNAGAPGTDGVNRYGVSFKRDPTTDTIFYTLHCGTITESVDTLLPHDTFGDSTWLLECELTGTSTMIARIFEVSEDLENPRFSHTLAGVAGLTAAYFVVSGLGNMVGTTPGYEAHCTVDFIDVEPGTGTTFDVGGLVTDSNTKLRPFMERTPIPLWGSDGDKSLAAKFSTDGGSDTVAITQTIVLSAEPTVVTIDSITSNSPIAVSGKPKVSFNDGFEDLEVQFRCSHKGPYQVVVDGLAYNSGRMVRAGVYTTIGAVETVNFSTHEFSDLADGVRTISVYVCRNPLL